MFSRPVTSGLNPASSRVTGRSEGGSGMIARLGFAAAMVDPPESLLVDEVLAVRDHSFKTKAWHASRRSRTPGPRSCWSPTASTRWGKCAGAYAGLRPAGCLPWDRAAEIVDAYHKSIRKVGKAKP